MKPILCWWYRKQLRKYEHTDAVLLAAARLEQLGWTPSTIVDRADFAVGKEDWEALPDLGEAGFVALTAATANPRFRPGAMAVLRRLRRPEVFLVLRVSARLIPQFRGRLDSWEELRKAAKSVSNELMMGPGFQIQGQAKSLCDEIELLGVWAVDELRRLGKESEDGTVEYQLADWIAASLADREPNTRAENTVASSEVAVQPTNAPVNEGRSDSDSSVEFTVTSVNISHSTSELSFKTVSIPVSPLKIEVEIRCHGCGDVFTHSESYDFAEQPHFATRRECPLCTADLSFTLEISQGADGINGKLCVTGETHLRHQTPGDVGVEIVSIVGGATQPTSERVLQIARQKTDPLPLDLLQEMNDINVVDEEGVSLLSHACNNHGREAVELLIEKGANLNHRSETGVFPLMAAVTSNSVENVKALLDAGVAVNRHTNRSGVTALHQAVCATCLMKLGEGNAPQKAREIALLLLDAGANPDTKDESGDTPLSEVESSLADQDGELKRRLLAAR